MKAIVPVHVERKILVLRGERVLLDADLAELYEVETRSLIQAVKRNAARFPADFMFQLTDGEAAILRSQTGISSAAHGGVATLRMPSPSTAWRCSPPCCVAGERYG
jgi:ORF6N domain